MRPVLGIDLGSSFSAVAVLDRHGRPEVLPDADGRPATPSMVHVAGPDEVLVGDEAEKLGLAEPERTFSFFKRHLGDPAWAVRVDGRRLDATELSAMVLRRLRGDAEAVVGGPLREAVLGVPAGFGSRQREALVEAARRAGLEPLGLVNEPTAAAVAAGIERARSPAPGGATLLVFDLGGGTFDATVVRVDGLRIRTLATAGDRRLGGAEWDARLLDLVAERFARRHGVDPRADALARRDLHPRCVAAKIALSSRPRALVPVAAAGRRDGIAVSREEFEVATRDLLARALRLCDRLVERAGTGWAGVDEVVLVGGSSRMPMVRRAVAEHARRPVRPHPRPEEAVVLGLALVGALRHRAADPAVRRLRRALARGRLREFALAEVATRPVGLLLRDRAGRERVAVVVAEGTPLPAERRWRLRTARDGQASLRVTVVEGRGERREEVDVLGDAVLDGLPPRPAGSPVEVALRLGTDQVVEVELVDPASGRRRAVRLAPGPRPAPPGDDLPPGVAAARVW